MYTFCRLRPNTRCFAVYSPKKLGEAAVFLLWKDFFVTESQSSNAWVPGRMPNRVLKVLVLVQIRTRMSLEFKSPLGCLLGQWTRFNQLDL